MRHLLRFTFVGMLTWTFAYAQDVPTRKPSMPPPLPEPTKKVKKIQELKRAAELLEKAHQEDMTELGISISNKVSQVDFSTSRFDVKIASISWMHNGLMQITFDYKEKE